MRVPKSLPAFPLLLALLALLAAAPAAAETRYNVPVGDSPAIGPANAPVTIVEFLDYQ